MAEMQTDEIQVAKNGIHCAECEARIERELSRVPGV